MPPTLTPRRPRRFRPRVHVDADERGVRLTARVQCDVRRGLSQAI